VGGGHRRPERVSGAHPLCLRSGPAARVKRVRTRVKGQLEKLLLLHVVLLLLLLQLLLKLKTLVLYRILLWLPLPLPALPRQELVLLLLVPIRLPLLLRPHLLGPRTTAPTATKSSNT